MQVFCKQLQVDSGVWEGVSFQQERSDQINESIKQITNFGKELQNLDDESWDEFTKTLSIGKIKNYLQVEWVIFKAIKKGADWVEKASVEVPEFFDFIGRKKYLLYLRTIKISSR